MGSGPWGVLVSGCPAQGGFSSSCLAAWRCQRLGSGAGGRRCRAGSERGEPFPWVGFSRIWLSAGFCRVRGPWECPRCPALGQRGPKAPAASLRGERGAVAPWGGRGRGDERGRVWRAWAASSSSWPRSASGGGEGGAGQTPRPPPQHGGYAWPPCHGQGVSFAPAPPARSCFSPAPASSACDLDFSAPDTGWVPTPLREPLLRCHPSPLAAPARAEPAPPPVSQHGPAAYRQLTGSPVFLREARPHRGEQRPSAAPAGPAPQPGARAEPGLSLGARHPPVSCSRPSSFLCARSRAAKGLDVPAAPASTRGVLASLPPLPRAPLPPAKPGEPTAAACRRHVGCIALATTEGPCSLLAGAWSRAGLGLDALCGCLVSGL